MSGCVVLSCLPQQSLSEGILHCAHAAITKHTQLQSYVAFVPHLTDMKNMEFCLFGNLAR